MAQREACDNCRFWSPAWRFKKNVGPPASGAEVTPLEVPRSGGFLPRKQADRGQCRRYAPRASALTTVWMETRSTDWCGDYQARPDEGA